MTILPYYINEINSNNITYSKLYNKETKTIIKYKEEALTIQTPWLYTETGICEYSSKYFIKCILNDNKKCNQDFKHFIKNVESSIIEYASTHNILNPFKTTINYDNTILFNIPYYNNHLKCDFYDATSSRHEVENITELIPQKCNTRFIITCKNIWKNETKFGVTWDVLQVQYKSEDIPSIKHKNAKNYSFKNE
mgnify:CR=1 FL=1